MKSNLNKNLNGISHKNLNELPRKRDIDEILNILESNDKFHNSIIKNPEQLINETNKTLSLDILEIKESNMYTDLSNSSSSFEGDIIIEEFEIDSLKLNKLPSFNVSPIPKETNTNNFSVEDSLNFSFQPDNLTGKPISEIIIKKVDINEILTKIDRVNNELPGSYGWGSWALVIVVVVGISVYVYTESNSKEDTTQIIVTNKVELPIVEQQIIETNTNTNLADAFKDSIKDSFKNNTAIAILMGSMGLLKFIKR